MVVVGGGGGRHERGAQLGGAVRRRRGRVLDQPDLDRDARRRDPGHADRLRHHRRRRGQAPGRAGEGGAGARPGSHPGQGRQADHQRRGLLQRRRAAAVRRRTRGTPWRCSSRCSAARSRPATRSTATGGAAGPSIWAVDASPFRTRESYEKNADFVLQRVKKIGRPRASTRCSCPASRRRARRRPASRRASPSPTRPGSRSSKAASRSASTCGREA